MRTLTCEVSMKIAGAHSKFGSGAYVDLDHQESAKAAEGVEKLVNTALTIAAIPLLFGLLCGGSSYSEEEKKLTKEEKLARQAAAEAALKAALARQKAEEAERRHRGDRSMKIWAVILAASSIAAFAFFHIYTNPSTPASVSCSNIKEVSVDYPGQDPFPGFSAIFPGSDPRAFVYQADGRFLSPRGQTASIDKPYLDCRHRRWHPEEIRGFCWLEPCQKIYANHSDVTDCRVCTPKTKPVLASNRSP